MVKVRWCLEQQGVKVMRVFTLCRLELHSRVSVDLKWLRRSFIVHLSGSAVKQQMRMMNPSLIKAGM